MYVYMYVVCRYVYRIVGTDQSEDHIGHNNKVPNEQGGTDFFYFEMDLILSNSIVLS